MADEKNTAGVTNPHDKVFRKTYSDRDNARSFLTHYLPDKVLKLVDLRTLEISKDSYIEKDLSRQERMAGRHHAADLVAVRPGG